MAVQSTYCAGLIYKAFRVLQQVAELLVSACPVHGTPAAPPGHPENTQRVMLTHDVARSASMQKVIRGRAGGGPHGMEGTAPYDNRLHSVPPR